MFYQIENVNKKTAIIKKNEIKILEIKNTIIEIKFHYKSTTADLKRNIGQLRLSSLENRKKKE